MNRFVAALFMLSGLMVAGGANAGTVAVTFAQVGSDVVVTAAGSLSSIPSGSIGFLAGQVVPGAGYVAFADPAPGRSIFRPVPCSVSPTSSFGTGGIINATSFSGNQLALLANGGPNRSLYLPPDFQGGSINSTITLGNRQLSSLGITPGGVTYTCGADTITVGVPIPAPTASSVSPTFGSTAGGTLVTITGTNLTGAIGITVGGAACTSVIVVSATSATCTTPSGTAGPAIVVVTTGGGSSAANLLFTYIDPTPSPTPSPAPIPTLSEWAEIMMMFLMILTVGWYGRRLKQR